MLQTDVMLCVAVTLYSNFLHLVTSLQTTLVTWQCYAVVLCYMSVPTLTVVCERSFHLVRTMFETNDVDSKVLKGEMSFNISLDCFLFTVQDTSWKMSKHLPPSDSGPYYYLSTVLVVSLKWNLDYHLISIFNY